MYEESFETKFPSIKQYPKEMVEEFKKNYLAQWVLTNCLDKAKVREAINKAMLEYPDTDIGVATILKEELGL